MSSPCPSCSTTILGVTLGDLCVLDFITSAFPDIDIEKLALAFSKANSQVPGGSIKNYVTSVLTNIGRTTSTNVGTAYYYTVITIFVILLFLYIITWSALIINETISIGAGIAIIFIGIFAVGIGLAIVLREVSSLTTAIATTTDTELLQLFDVISCALTAGTCCYSTEGCPLITCCCPRAASQVSGCPTTSDPNPCQGVDN